jgi:hypothetical protein
MLLLSHSFQNLVQEFITDEFKTAVQAVLDQALRGEETANFGELSYQNFRTKLSGCRLVIYILTMALLVVPSNPLKNFLS